MDSGTNESDHMGPSLFLSMEGAGGRRDSLTFSPLSSTEAFPSFRPWVVPHDAELWDLCWWSCAHFCQYISREFYITLFFLITPPIFHQLYDYLCWGHPLTTKKFGASFEEENNLLVYPTRDMGNSGKDFRALVSLMLVCFCSFLVHFASCFSIPSVNPHDIFFLASSLPRSLYACQLYFVYTKSSI